MQDEHSQYVQELTDNPIEGPLTANLLSIQVGLPRMIGNPDVIDQRDEIWTTGIFKHPIAGPIRLGHVNLEGDGQADAVNHGGPDKAVNVYPMEHYAYWEMTLGLRGLSHGAFGENFTTAGLLETDVCIGDVFSIGDAIVQISQPRQPCWKLARRWHRKDLAIRVQESGRTGWYFRVLREGFVETGKPLILIERSYPQWTVSAANSVMHARTLDIESTRSLLNCLPLSARWRHTLEKRISTGVIANNTARLYDQK